MRQNSELQIRLTQIQTDHEDLASRLTTVLAIGFTAVVGLAQIFYTLMVSSHLLPSTVSEFAPFMRIAIILLQCLSIVFMYQAYRNYKRERKKLKEQMNKLRKEYAW
jgi:hypothetical protein